MTTLPETKQENIDSGVGSVDNSSNSSNNTTTTTTNNTNFSYTSNSAIHPSLAAMSTDSTIYSNPSDFNSQYQSYYPQQQQETNTTGPLNLMSISNITSPNSSNRNLNGRTALPPLQSASSSNTTYYKPPAQDQVFDSNFTSKRSKSFSNGNNANLYDSNPVEDPGLTPQSWSQRQPTLLPDSLPSVNALQQQQQQQHIPPTSHQPYTDNYQNTTDLPHGMLIASNPPDPSFNQNGKRPNDQFQSPGPARKKRQCSECHGWFSNLATHRSIHLANTSRPHTCDICNRGFARPNDLFRHQKSHRGEAPFRCPLFVRGPVAHNHLNLEPACHQNGGFSRCDTYKNHLKAMHFEYPPGTKKKMRNGVAGKCKACQMEFESSDQWIAQHIETGACKVVQQIKEMTIKSQMGVN